MPAPAEKPDALAFTSVLTGRSRLDVLNLGGLRAIVGTSPATDSMGPFGEYMNRFYQVDGASLRRAKDLEKGVWSDFQITRAQGTWPDAAEFRGVNYGNTAWESVHFLWRGESWKPEQSRSFHAWPGGRVQLGAARAADTPAIQFEPSAEAVGIPERICDGVAACAASRLVAPRDIYAPGGTCERFGSCSPLESILHWCTPRAGFERIDLPSPVPNGEIIAVPGALLVVGPDRYLLLRDGAWTELKAPEPDFRFSWLEASGGALWYLGREGVYRLSARGFQRVAAWTREPPAKPSDTVFGLRNTTGVVTLPGAKGPAILTGFLAHTPEELWLTTWNGKDSQVWSTVAQPLKLVR